MSKATLAQEVESLIREKISPTKLEVIDDSEAHIGHAGSREHGGAHFKVFAESAAFTGLSRVQRHRIIHDALDELLKSNCIHALALKLESPS